MRDLKVTSVSGSQQMLTGDENGVTLAVNGSAVTWDNETVAGIQNWLGERDKELQTAKLEDLKKEGPIEDEGNSDKMDPEITDPPAGEEETAKE